MHTWVSFLYYITPHPLKIKTRAGGYSLQIISVHFSNSTLMYIITQKWSFFPPLLQMSTLNILDYNQFASVPAIEDLNTKSNIFHF